ncbi:unnamed protein product [Arabidopsis arenosa]|uniref:Uncharacterized protein n=3 Tax=Arabidopsis TaxID=3701 RepID=A0A8T2AJD0_ARASU|nr:hypothetical protein ISN45_Aa04g019730 [Arabidopsis thaliana x Arabidopsis arenosa]KAG7573680.1 hypothetical protein ISN44_As09g019450 [Arabidopsis suecica]CAE6030448.1 unnamed protein product [Arabidopsis arenosa]
MSLNCLACHILQRTDSDREIGSLKDSNFKENFATSRYDKMVRNRSSLPVVRRVNKGHRRLYSAEIMVYGELDEPKLVRSSGIRRDWSFEDLKKHKDQLRIEETIKE